MNKKIKILPKIFFVWFVFTATPGSANNNYFPYLYFGFQGGFSHSKADVKHRFFLRNAGGPPPAGFDQDTTTKRKLTSKRFVIEPMFGVRTFLWNNFMVGLEILASFSNHKRGRLFPLIEIGELYVSVEKKYSIIPAFVFGWRFCKQWLVFAKLGVLVSRYKINLFNNDSQMGFTSNYTSVGFAPSVGLEYAFCPMFSGIVTGSYELNPQIKASFNDVIVAPGSPNGSRISGCIHTFAVKAGLLFKL